MPAGLVVQTTYVYQAFLVLTPGVTVWLRIAHHRTRRERRSSTTLHHSLPTTPHSAPQPVVQRLVGRLAAR